MMLEIFEIQIQILISVTLNNADTQRLYKYVICC